MRKFIIRNMVVIMLALAATTALAHQTKDVAGGYRVSAGFVTDPAYTGVLNALDLIVRDAEGNPVENLERSLTAVLIAPGGAELNLKLSAAFGEPGVYRGSFIPTVVGDYAFRISGFIGAAEFDELFDQPAHSEPSVLDAREISLP